MVERKSHIYMSTLTRTPPYLLKRRNSGMSLCHSAIVFPGCMVNELLLRKVRPRHFVGTPKLEYSYNV